MYDLLLYNKMTKEASIPETSDTYTFKKKEREADAVFILIH